MPEPQQPDEPAPPQRTQGDLMAALYPVPVAAAQDPEPGSRPAASGEPETEDPDTHVVDLRTSGGTEPDAPDAPAAPARQAESDGAAEPVAAAAVKAAEAVAAATTHEHAADSALHHAEAMMRRAAAESEELRRAAEQARHDAEVAAERRQAAEGAEREAREVAAARLAAAQAAAEEARVEADRLRDAEQRRERAAEQSAQAAARDEATAVLPRVPESTLPPRPEVTDAPSAPAVDVDETGSLPAAIEGDDTAETPAATGVAASTRVAHDMPVPPVAGSESLVGMEARSVSAWFGDHKVLDGVSMTIAPGEVTALIGPSGCGKSTFLRILNRMHELVRGAALAGEVLLDGMDIYESGRRPADVRRRIGMVFQRPNPFPAMSIYDNVVSGLKLAGIPCDDKDSLVEQSLLRAGLWAEVRNRLESPGGALSGGQQQRLCIARSLAVTPDVLLMDEPCSALDPTSTRRIEDTIRELRGQVTIVIVTHNMQQAARVSHACAFFLATHDTPGHIVEAAPTEQMFSDPRDSRTADYVNGRFG